MKKKRNSENRLDPSDAAVRLLILTCLPPGRLRQGNISTEETLVPQIGRLEVVQVRKHLDEEVVKCRLQGSQALGKPVQR